MPLYVGIPLSITYISVFMKISEEVKGYEVLSYSVVFLLIMFIYLFNGEVKMLVAS